MKIDKSPVIKIESTSSSPNLEIVPPPLVALFHQGAQRLFQEIQDILNTFEPGKIRVESLVYQGYQTVAFWQAPAPATSIRSDIALAVLDPKV